MTLSLEVGPSNEKSYLLWPPNLAYSDLTRTGEGWNWEK